MKNIFWVLLVFLLFAVSCKSNAKDKVKYSSYHNEKYDYKMEYPDFMIPQRESANGDGRIFISKDGNNRIYVYHDKRLNYDTEESISDVYFQDLSSIQSDNKAKILHSVLFDNYFKIDYQRDDKRIKQTTIYAEGNFFTLLFEFTEKDYDKCVEIIDHIINSFKVGNNYFKNSNSKEIHRIERNLEVEKFLTIFLDNCFWGKNIDKMLVDKEQVLMEYVDPQIDVRRYHNPGAIPILYNRKQGFGFEAVNFKVVYNNNNQMNIVPMFLASPCEFNIDGNDDGVYYSFVSSVPDSVNSETFEIVSVSLPDSYKSILRVHIIGNKFGLRTLYFIKSASSNWKLAFIDDSECSA